MDKIGEFVSKEDAERECDLEQKNQNEQTERDDLWGESLSSYQPSMESGPAAALSVESKPAAAASEKSRSVAMAGTAHTACEETGRSAAAGTTIEEAGSAHMADTASEETASAATVCGQPGPIDTTEEQSVPDTDSEKTGSSSGKSGDGNFELHTINISSPAAASVSGSESDVQSAARVKVETRERNPMGQGQGAERIRHYIQNANDRNPSEKPSRRNRKSGSLFRGALVSISMGLLFGLFAGIGFYAVQQAIGVRNSGVSEEPLVTQEELETVLRDWELRGGMDSAEVREISYVTSDMSEVVSRVIPAMVAIVSNHVEEGVSFFGQTYSEVVPSSGSGFILGESETELLIATNYHVVKDTMELQVTFIDGTMREAEVKGTDSDMDLAVIAIPLEELEAGTRNQITFVTLGNSNAIKMGEPVIAIGNTLGYGLSMTGGYVSAPEREVTMEDGSTGTFIQTDAAINPGNSGGALLNINGEVVGINSSKIGDTLVEGIGFAIPISAAEPIISELMLQETKFKVSESDRGYIGIVMEEIDSRFAQIYGVPSGAFVKEVTEDSPAEAAGILPGDVIVALDGQEVSSIQVLQKILEYYAAGTDVTVTVKRLERGSYQSIEIPLTLGVKPK